MPQYCLLFYANYTILGPKGGAWPNAPPPKYAPGFRAQNRLLLRQQFLRNIGWFSA